MRNVLEAMENLKQKVVKHGQGPFLNPEMLKDFNKQIGKDLGEIFDAIPGKLRTDSRVVGRYKCPDYEDLNALLNAYCDWQKEEFKYGPAQPVWLAIVQAVVAHIYLEWIHPFGDGNGRTGRLLETYILLRAGVPIICSHLLSNHYNNTRPQYYAHFDRARQSRNLTSFIAYAIQGFCDGLKDVEAHLNEQMRELVWKDYVNDVLKQQTGLTGVRRRRLRDLANILYNAENGMGTVHLIKLMPAEYKGKDARVIKNDLDVLNDLHLILKDLEGRAAADKSMLDLMVAPSKKLSSK